MRVVRRRSRQGLRDGVARTVVNVHAHPAQMRDWLAREAPEALPSEEEITRIRRLITRIKADVDALSGAERAQIEAAVSVVRRARNGVTNLSMPSIRQPVPDVRPDRTA